MFWKHEMCLYLPPPPSFKDRFLDEPGLAGCSIGTSISTSRMPYTQPSVSRQWRMKWMQKDN